MDVKYKILCSTSQLFKKYKIKQEIFGFTKVLKTYNTSFQQNSETQGCIYR